MPMNGAALFGVVWGLWVLAVVVTLPAHLGFVWLCGLARSAGVWLLTTDR